MNFGVSQSYIQLGMFVQATARTADDQYVYYQEFYIPRVDRPIYFSEEVAFVPERHRALRGRGSS